MIAMHIFALAAQDGRVNWTAVPMLAAWLGVQDVDDLMHRLTVIQLHRKPEEAT